MIIILWVYLAGILPVLCLAFNRIAQNLPHFKRKYDQYQFSLNMTLWYGLCIIGAGLWPLALPAAISHMRGFNVAQQNEKLAKQLKESEKQLADVKKQEGWT